MCYFVIITRATILSSTKIGELSFLNTGYSVAYLGEQYSTH